MQREGAKGKSESIVLQLLFFNIYFNNKLLHILCCGFNYKSIVIAMFNLSSISSIRDDKSIINQLHYYFMAEEGKNKKPIPKKLIGVLIAFGIAIFWIIFSSVLNPIVSAIFLPYIPYLLLSLHLAQPSIAVVAFNGTASGNNYTILVQNEGNNTSSGFGFNVRLLNNNSQISKITKRFGSSHINYTILLFDKEAFVNVYNLPPAMRAILEINITNYSKINITMATPDSQVCIAIIYGLVAPVVKSNDYVINEEASSKISNCASNVLNKIIWYGTVIFEHTDKFNINCTNSQTYSIFTNDSNRIVSISRKSLQPLQYSVYKNDTLLYVVNSETPILINLSQTNSFYFIKVYTPGNQNYTCAETILFVNPPPSLSINPANPS